MKLIKGDLVLEKGLEAQSLRGERERLKENLTGLVEVNISMG